MTKRPGQDNELMLVEYLRAIYPGAEISWIANDRKQGKRPFDILVHGCCLLDAVGVDKDLRLIIDHKDRMKHHIKEQKAVGLPGFVCFEFLGCFYYLPVDNETLRKQIRPKINGYILRACKHLPIPDSYKRLWRVHRVELVPVEDNQDSYNFDSDIVEKFIEKRKKIGSSDHNSVTASFRSNYVMRPRKYHFSMSDII